MRARSLLGAALAALVLASCGAAPRPLRAPATPAGEPFARTVAVLKTANWGSKAALAAQRRALLRAEVARLRRSPTVGAALRVARLTGRVSHRSYVRMQRDWRRAQAVLPRLNGTRRAELASVVGDVRSLAARRMLAPDRVVPTFLILRRNTYFWTRAALPAPRWRTTFGDDPAVFQYYPGHGLQLQPLASWGRVNAQARACLAGRCRAATLRRELDRLSDLGARRAGYTAWEYYFAFGGGTPPWVSGMTQATAAQALARGYKALGVKRFRRAAVRALGAFELPPPAGVVVGGHYRQYSFAPGYEILNGELQAITGLHDVAELTGSRLAARLFARGDRTARSEVAGFDTGAWSLYSAQGDESTLPYHELLAGFLENLCTRTSEPIYCRTATRFVRYEHEPPRIGVSAPGGLRVHRTVPLRFSLSKVSSVSVRVSGPHGVSLARSMQLPHGAYTVDWTPPARGHFKLRIEARGPSGPLGIARRTLSVRLPKPHKKHRHTDLGKTRKRAARWSPRAARSLPLPK